MKLKYTSFFFSAAHTPDNSFMGFVTEELNQTERFNIKRDKVNNMAVVYGKEASMWKVRTHTSNNSLSKRCVSQWLTETAELAEFWHFSTVCTASLAQHLKTLWHRCCRLAFSLCNCQNIQRLIAWLLSWLVGHSDCGKVAFGCADSK